VESTLLLAVRARAGDGHVMTIQQETEGLLQVLAQHVEMGGGDLEGRTALLAREVTVDRTGQVVHRSVLIEVRVHDDLQRLELLEDSIDGRRAHVRLAFLDFVGDLVGREVTGCAYEDLGDGPLGDRGASVSPSDRRDDLVDVAVKVNHGKTLCPSPRVPTDNRH